MNDITELAQSLKRRAASANEFGESLYVKADDVLALVEALESEKRICATWRKTAKSAGEKLEKAQTINAAAEKLVRCKGRYHSEQNYRALAALFGVNTPDLPPLEHENVHYVDAAEMEIAALRQRIAELESRTVTVKLPESFKLAKSSSGLRYYYADEVDAAIIAAGIKVETE
ncbi:ead/Ea22-like family protein [Klebsiella pneumoniae]|uniref:ead/Ea22-like family protein n=1 Tax=Klebsiella pneumoniae TaxID=573 RepID=UPI001143406F|nr:ead/Ea22-like family protein [Klebsiella pneumoniae]TYX36877.1 ead/Ea22-like family protein [Klebsiella pneumoniae]TYX60228.1 ead/Ea22-like family protein [Klebsiella pneumoniae]TYX70206.1 ead/Ea22-like family protein [Klebsiella pneumoniae]TYY14292.1 ead/Ea22-like family protein [Klebsiella pneumoniae]TYY70062.1 ead/Ea22-like family protein [Klebsiella pneumoniae]